MSQKYTRVKPVNLNAFVHPRLFEMLKQRALDEGISQQRLMHNILCDAFALEADDATRYELPLSSLARGYVPAKKEKSARVKKVPMAVLRAAAAEFAGDAPKP